MAISLVAQAEGLLQDLHHLHYQVEHDNMNFLAQLSQEGKGVIWIRRRNQTQHQKVHVILPTIFQEEVNYLCVLWGKPQYNSVKENVLAHIQRERDALVNFLHNHFVSNRKTA